MAKSRGNQDIYERTWQNCNCGVGSGNQQVNCYSNCNCNCNCNCGSCFPAATPVAMADGSLRAIAGVRVGDKVMGESNRTATVVGLYRVKLGDRVLFEIDGTLRTTGDHLLRTASGWGAILPALYAERCFGQMFPVIVDEAGTVVPMINAVLPPASIVKIADGIRLVRGDGSLQLARSVVPMADVSADLDLFCLVLDGARGFIAGGFVVDGFIRG